MRPHDRNSFPDWIGLGGASLPRWITAEAVNSSNDAIPLGAGASLRRAFEELGLSGVLLQDGQPLAYVYETADARLNPTELERLHQQFWCQGMAPVLLVLSRTEFQILSGLVPPRESQPADRLIVTLQRATQSMEARALLRSLASGDFFRFNQSYFRREDRVDQRLLGNLQAARKRLLDGQDRLPLETADRLLCRIALGCYLFDRGILGPTYLREANVPDGVNRLPNLFRGRTPKLAVDALYSLFARLKSDFNGDLFEGELDAERGSLNDSHCQTLADWLCGTEVTGQLSFLDYDFRVIPIETISAIYERFLPDEDREEEGAIYKPRLLADLVLDEALAGREHPSALLQSKYLDPSCGSGIFLVGLFQRMAEAWRRQNPNANYVTRFRALRDLLTERLRGVDKNETACRIASFSLYLALLDQLDPSDLMQLKEVGEKLPPLISQQKTRWKGQTLWPCKFEDAQRADLAADGFDLIVGNPPWVSRKGGDSNEDFDEEEAETPDEPSDSDTYAALPEAARQRAHRFLFRSPDFLAEDGRVCFILPYGLLFHLNQTGIEVQRELFSRHSVERVVNLSDLRFFLFEDEAIHPPVIIRYRRDAPKSAERRGASIEYLCPKATWTARQTGRIELAAIDVTPLDPRALLSQLSCGAVPIEWKQHLWGTPRDGKLLDLLRSYSTLGDRISASQDTASNARRWYLAGGFQPGRKDSDKKYDPFPKRELFVDTRNLKLVLTENDCQRAEKAILRKGTKRREADPPLSQLPLRRNPEAQMEDPALRQAQSPFEPPHVLFSKGGRVAYADFRVVFQHSVYGIHGPVADEQALRFLAAFLDSSLADYFLFHSAASPGQERGDCLIKELRRLPFPLPNELRDPTTARATLREIARRMQETERRIAGNVVGQDVTIERLRADCHGLVLDYFDLLETERILLREWQEVVSPSCTPNSLRPVPAHAPSRTEHRDRYVRRLLETFNGFFPNGPHRFDCTLRLTAEQADIGVVGLAVSSKRTAARPIPGEQAGLLALEATLDRLAPHLDQTDGAFDLRRGVCVFVEDGAYLLLPLKRRFWTETAALNDADTLAAALHGAPLGRGHV